MPSPSQISTTKLARLIGTPDAPTIVDVRTDEDFQTDSRFIPTAFRVDYTQALNVPKALLRDKVVVYCQKGKKLSEGVAALFRSRNISAEILIDGFHGWRDANLPLVPLNKHIPVEPAAQSLWVTRHRPKIDRIACPWLIKRFVDPRARFLFVPPAEVLDVADRFNAIPFDMQDVYFSHRGELCTFDTMLSEFELGIPALLHMAEVIRAADTDRLHVSPQAAGLLAVSLGLSRMYRNDLEQLDASMLVYDALYRWCRDATEETHQWP